MTLKFSATDEGGEGGALEPLLFAKRAHTPSYPMIGLQALAGLAGLIVGAHLFVTAAETMAATLSISPLILALLIAPLATELPEMSNSFLWLYRKKDRLAVGNVTGAMVFQGTFPVSVGLLGTEWALAPSALATMVLAVAAAGFCLLQIAVGGHWRPWLLSGGALLYIGYAVYLYGF
jgi:cation:H+ antiporter